MSLPEPEYPLDHVCSVLHENTLYTYSSSGFQSLELKQGAEWKKLKSGESVEGGACVNVPSGDPSLWIVGGQSSTEDYMGLQRFTYSTGEWETIRSQEPVAKDRRWHGAAYLPSTDQIVTYAGNDDGNMFISTSSFTIRASEPYDSQAYMSNEAPPTQNPIVLTWSDTHVAMLGGAVDNTKVMLFNPQEGWMDSGIQLAEPFAKDTSQVKAILVTGTDGSKNLVTFDASESPNQVQRIVLAGAGGEPVESAAVVGSGDAKRDAADSQLHGSVRRDLTVDDWPSYNDTMAPEVTRSNFALAEGDGMVVLAGGNDDDPLSLFDVNENSWEDASLALASEQEVLSNNESSSSSSSSASSTSSSSASSSSSSSSASSASSSTVSSTSSASAESASSTSASATSGGSPTSVISASASASASESAAAAAGGDDSSGGGGLSHNAILGIVLGTISGAAIILALILFCLRRKQQRRRALEENHNKLAREASSRRQAEKGMSSEFEKEVSNGDLAPPPMMRGHQATDSSATYSSMAILMNQMQKPGDQSGEKRMTQFPGTAANKDMISKPIPQIQEPGGPQEQRGPGMDEEAGVVAARAVGQPRRPPPPPGAPEDPTRRSSGWNRYWSGGSALGIFGYGGSQNKRMTQESDSSQYSAKNRITQDSATVPPLNFEGRPQMNSVASGSPTVSTYPSKAHLNEGQAGKIESERPISGASSGYSSGVPESVRETWGPIAEKKPWGTARAPSSAYSESFYHPTSLAPSTRAPSMSNPPPIPDGISKQPQLSTAAASSDLSWLNLGEQQQTNNNGGYNGISGRF